MPHLLQSIRIAVMAGLVAALAIVAGCSSATQPHPLPKPKTTANELMAVKFFEHKGLKPKQAAGAVGSMVDHTGLNPNFISRGFNRRGEVDIGIFGWNNQDFYLEGQRAKAAHASVYSLQFQLGEVWRQINVQHDLKYLKMPKLINRPVPKDDNNIDWTRYGSYQLFSYFYFDGDAQAHPKADYSYLLH